MRGRSIVACAFATVCGCSLVYSKDLDEARAPTDVPDSGGTSSTSSAGGEGGITKTDSGSGSSSSRGCNSVSPTPKFCVDFDGPSAGVGDDWDLDARGGTVDFDTTDFWSGTRSAKATLSTHKDCQYDRLEHTFHDSGKDRWEFHLQMRPAHPWSGFTPLVLNISSGDKECQPLISTHSDSNARIDQVEIDVQTGAGATNDDRPLGGVPPTDEWSPVSVVVTTNGGNGLDLATTLAGTTTKYTFTQCPSSWDTITLNVGFHCDTGSGSIDYDDVWADWDSP